MEWLLADCVIGNEFFDEIFDLGVVVFETAAFLGCKDNVFNRLNLCGRTGETDLLRICVNVCCAPLLDVEIWASVNKSLIFIPEFGLLSGRNCVHVFHQTTCVAGTAFCC